MRLLWWGFWWRWRYSRRSMPKGAEPEACMPCRGAGKVISNLGGESRQVNCPWCQGGGVRLAGIDAQAAWLEGGAAGSGGGEAPVEPLADVVV